MWPAPRWCTSSSAAGQLSSSSPTHAGVIEVDVGEQDLAHVAEADALGGKLGLQVRAAWSSGPGR